MSFQLRTDVASWYDTQTTSEMRYPTQSKRFWTLGFKLFREKNIQLWVATRTFGQISAGLTAKGHTTPSDSKINFAVPHVNVLRAEINKGGCSFEKPGILTENIELFGQLHCNKSATICIDGKN